MDRQLFNKSSSNNLSNENLKADVSRNMIFQKYIFITQIIWLTFHGIIDKP